MTTTDSAIRVENVKKTFRLPRQKTDSVKEVITQLFKSKDQGYDTHHALKDISFEVKKGEFFGVLGRNGTGKSTLLKIMAEIYQPTKGSVKVDGKLVPFIELGVGFNPNLSGRENVYLNGALLGFSKKEIDERYQTIVEFAELEEFMDQKLKNYSSGMKVRLAFSVAIQADADILLLDEVLAVGDAAFQKKCYEYFDSLKEKKKTIVFVTHNMAAVRKYCDRAVLIEKGKIAFEGAADDIADEYLKLFVRPKKAEPKTRFGSGTVSIQQPHVEVSKQAVILDLPLAGTVDTKIDVAIDIYKAGKLVAGSSSKELKHTIHIKEDKKTNVRIVIDNVFGAGDYQINASVRDAVSGEILDFCRNVATFENEYHISEYLPIILPVKFEDK